VAQPEAAVYYWGEYKLHVSTYYCGLRSSLGQQPNISWSTGAGGPACHDANL